MKQWKRSSILILLCMFSFGCGQTEEVVEESTKTISIDITPMATKTPTEAEATPIVEELVHNQSDGFPINMEMVIDVDACNGINRKLTRDRESGTSLFCLDNEEVVYFVNQNQDNYLYCMKDGKVELAVALPVKEIYPWENFVYFMIASEVSDEREEKKVGDIYRYVPKTKEVELVYALGTIQGGENHKLNVNEQGIHFNYSETISSEDGITRVKVSSYTLPFDSTEPVKDTTKMGKAGWGDYYFSYVFDTPENIEPVKVSLVSRTKGEEDRISLEIGEFQYCVVNDTIYSMKLGSSAVSVLDLKTQRSRNYNFRTRIIEANRYLNKEIEHCFGEGMEEFCSFTITENGDVLWITDGEYLYRMDMNTENKRVHMIATVHGNRKIEQLYTDGRRLYGLYASERTEAPRFVRFCTETIETVEKDKLNELTIEVEYLVPQEGDILVSVPETDEEICVRHSFQIQNEQHSVLTAEHPYLCGQIENRDGTEEYVYQDCTITTTIDTYGKKCEECNQEVEQLGFGEKKTHSKCDF